MVDEVCDEVEHPEQHPHGDDGRPMMNQSREYQVLSSMGMPGKFCFAARLAFHFEK